MTAIKSVLQLGRHKVGDTAWTIIITPNEPEVPEEDDWMASSHPRYLYETHWHGLWPQGVTLPRIEAISFRMVAWLITSKIEIAELTIGSISREGGEYLYSPEDSDDQIPEFALFDSKEAARAEKSRILRLIRKWADEQDR